MAPTNTRSRAPSTPCRSWTYWGLTALVVAAYSAYYAAVIARQTFVPYFDQANYVSRVYHIQEAIARQGCWKPSTYLGGPYSARPPLLLAPAAWLLPSDADPREMALLWLGLRTAALVAGLLVMARVARSARFVPLAAMVALGSAFFLDASQQLYLMDQAFGCFALLVAACLAWEMQDPGAWSALALTTSVFMLILVKPAGLLFALPVLAAAGAAGIPRVARGFARRGERARTARWAAAWMACPIGFALLLRSKYWASAMQIWRESWQGWWETPRSEGQEWHCAVLMIPSWLAVLAMIVAWRRRKSSGSDRPRGLALAALGLVTGWWFVYNAWLGFSFDERFPACMVTVTAAVASLLVSRDRVIHRVALAVAATFFVANLAIAARFGRPDSLQWLQAITGPLSRRAWTVAEVGERPMCRAIRDEIEKTGARSASVRLLVCDDYVDYSALDLALRFESGNRWSPIAFVGVPFGDERLDRDMLATSEWLLTKRPHDAIELSRGALAALRGLDHLITDEGSPLRRHVTRVRDFVLRQPEDPGLSLFHGERPFRLRNETVTLWHLETPSPEEIATACAWLDADRRTTSR
jgi:hypothetical protein